MGFESKHDSLIIHMHYINLYYINSRILQNSTDIINIDTNLQLMAAFDN